MYYILRENWNKTVDTQYMANKPYATIEEAQEKVFALKTLNDNEDTNFFIVKREVA